LRFVAVALGAFISGCDLVVFPPGGQAGAVRAGFDFENGSLGWSANVADYPTDQEGNLQFQARLRAFPEETGIPNTGLYVQSVNSPDDLFTFIKRRLDLADGIAPGRLYRVRIKVWLASNAPSGCAGAGGAPGESVYLKVGASGIEPEPVETVDGTEVLMNIDVGDQAEGGASASTAGVLANGLPCDLVPDLEVAPYVLIYREREHNVPVRSSEFGDLWLLVGTDSGYESLTAIYYQRIEAELVPVSESDGR